MLPEQAINQQSVSMFWLVTLRNDRWQLSMWTLWVGISSMTSSDCFPRMMNVWHLHWIPPTLSYLLSKTVYGNNQCITLKVHQHSNMKQIIPLQHGGCFEEAIDLTLKHLHWFSCITNKIYSKNVLSIYNRAVRLLPVAVIHTHTLSMMLKLIHMLPFMLKLPCSTIPIHKMVTLGHYEPLVVDRWYWETA